jgi:hypothetical protein
MNVFDLNTRQPLAPVTLVQMPFNPVIATTTAQQAQGTLNGFAMDFMLALKEAGCDPSEGFAVCSILESMIRDHSKIVDTSPEEYDMVWNEDRFA